MKEQAQSTGENSDNDRSAVVTSMATAVSQIREMPRDTWLDLLRCHQADNWRIGVRVPAEEYLVQLPQIKANVEEAMVMICGEVQVRRQLGEEPTLEEFQCRFPELAEELTRQFELDEVLDSPPIGPSFHGGAEYHEVSPELPGYKFIEELGNGASGVVYRARQESLNRFVAIKVLTRRIDPKQLARQHREAEILAQLQHPNVVQIHEVVSHAGRLHLVMEYVDGSTLKEWAGGKPLSTDEAVRLILIMSETIQSVHASGILHRDLKPSNVLMSSKGQPKITDFGLARWHGTDSFVSSEDGVLGTPSYMAPEQALGKHESTSPTADVYSLGAIFYELLTGRPPFLGATVLETLSLVREREPVSPRHLQPRIGRDLETICLTCLAKTPDKRYASAGELAEDLRRYLAGLPVLARRAGWCDKGLRWCRRNPTVAILSSCLLLVVAVGFAAVVWKWRDAERARRDEQTARYEVSQREREVREGLERLKQATELLDRGRVYAGLRRWDDAEEYFSKAIELRTEHAPTWEERGQLYARLGLWDLASADLSRAFELNQPMSSVHWWWHAVLCRSVGDEFGYRRVRDKMRDRFQRTNAVDDLVRIWCLTDEQQTDIPPDWFIELAETVLRTSPREKRFLYLSGLAHYRVGRYRKAIERCQDSAQSVPHSPNDALNFPVLAMAYYKLGEPEQSRAAMEKATQAIQQWVQRAYDGQSDAWVINLGAEGTWPISHWEYLEFKLVYREARTLLGLKFEDDPRLHVLRGRALAGLRRSREADEEFSAALELDPIDPRIRLELHRNRGYIYSANSQFDRAAEEFAAAAKLRPDDSDLLRFQAVCHWLARDFSAYGQVCHGMLAKFGQTEVPAIAYDVVDACVLQLDSITDMSRLVPLAEIASTWYMGAVRIQGAALYRAGQFEESLRCFQEAQKFHRFRPWDWAFTAMIHHHLGHPREASQCLADAQRWMQEADQQQLDDLAGERPSWGAWHERADASRLLEEAAALIQIPATP